MEIKEFIELRDFWGNYTTQQIKRDQARKLVRGIFKLGIAKRLAYQLNKNTITNTICILNIMIPCTAWPITNPIIQKISREIDGDKIGRKINCFRIRFR